jgi:beta-xylosidase
MPINGAHFCSLWAPQLVALGPASYLLTFTGRRYEAPQARCAPYDNDSGVYFAWSDSPLGPFARAVWEPLPAGASRGPGEPALYDDAPRSPLWASTACAGGRCDRTMRLDSDVFLDEATGRRWLAYSWYTESPPRTAWERDHHGEHVSLVELDRADPLLVRRSPAPVEILAGDAHDRRTLERLRASCDRCGEMLSMTTDRRGDAAVRDGRSWGVAEGAALFRRGGFVYLLMSGSLWDSAYYHVFWAAARSVEELAADNPGRLVGRYLVPSRGQSFGHGSPVLGPDGEHFYYVHHRLRADACRAGDDCARDVWVSPIEFEDRGDGLGDVHIKARFPAEEPDTEIALPG